MRKRWIIAVAVLMAVGGLVASRVPGLAQAVLRILYVNVDVENLRDTPRGRVIAQVNKGTKLEVLEETDKWVKVQVTGWIWKESTSPVRPKDLAGAMRAYHIMVKTREEAEEILRLLQQGADFQQLARERSIGPTASEGGDLGYFFPGDFSPEIDEAIRNLKPGEISGIIQTKDGFHIFKRVK